LREALSSRILQGETKLHPARSEQRVQLDGTNDLQACAGMEEAAATR
jgi:hypothetical protein